MQIARLAKRLPNGNAQNVAGALAGSIGPSIPVHSQSGVQQEAEEEEDFT